MKTFIVLVDNDEVTAQDIAESAMVTEGASVHEIDREAVRAEAKAGARDIDGTNRDWLEGARWAIDRLTNPRLLG